MPTLSYDVYYWRDGRWVLQKEYGPGERVIALSEAVNIDANLGQAACVVSTEVDEHNVATETVRFSSIRAKKQNLSTPSRHATPAKKKPGSAPAGARERASAAAPSTKVSPTASTKARPPGPAPTPHAVTASRAYGKANTPTEADHHGQPKRSQGGVSIALMVNGALFAIGLATIIILAALTFGVFEAIGVSNGAGAMGVALAVGAGTLMHFAKAFEKMKFNDDIVPTMDIETAAAELAVRLQQDAGEAAFVSSASIAQTPTSAAGGQSKVGDTEKFILGNLQTLLGAWANQRGAYIDVRGPLFLCFIILLCDELALDANGVPTDDGRAAVTRAITRLGIWPEAQIAAINHTIRANPGVFSVVAAQAADAALALRAGNLARVELLALGLKDAQPYLEPYFGNPSRVSDVAEDMPPGIAEARS